MQATETKLTAVADWLMSCAGVVKAFPISVSIRTGKTDKSVRTFEGCAYVVASTRSATERAVTEGGEKAGDTYYETRLYLLGEKPTFRRANCCFPEEGRSLDNPLSLHVSPSPEWYVGGYCTADTARNPQFSKYHPFGPYFQLHAWTQGYGHYEGTKIDTFERAPYVRYPLTIKLV